MRIRYVLPLMIILATNVYAQQIPQQVPEQDSQQNTVQSPWIQEMSSGVRDVGEERFDDAEKSFEKAIELVKDEEDNARLPAALNNLGVLRQRQGRINDAEPLHGRALQLREEILGKEHPDVAQSLNNLATVYLEQRKYAQAIPLYERAIAIWEKTRGKEYHKIAAALNNLATLYEAQGQYDVAKRKYDESLALWEKNRGGDSDLQYAQTLENYAGLLRRVNDQPNAAQAVSKAKALRAAVARASTASIQ